MGAASERVHDAVAAIRFLLPLHLTEGFIDEVRDGIENDVGDDRVERGLFFACEEDEG